MIQVEMKRFYLLPFALVLLQLTAFTQSDSLPSFLRDSLDNYVSRGMKNWNIPGVALAVVKDGKVVRMKGYGVKTLDGNDKVDENTLFMIGSNTKAFTGTLMAMLEAEKKLSLNDKVTKWIPSFRLDNKAAGEQAIIRDLLCHRLGFMTFQGDFTYWTSTLTREEVMEKMSHIKAVYPFRTTWGYTNAGFLTAGQIIPAVTGMSWEEYLRKAIFTPLEMKNTVALGAEFNSTPNHANAHTLQEGRMVRIPIAKLDNLAPAGSIGSSVNDLSHWVIMQLNDGKYMDKQVVPSAAIAQTRKPHSIIGNGGALYNTGHFQLYGLGWQLSEYCGRKIIEHDGGVNGFVTHVTLVPEEKLGIVVLTNTDQNTLFLSLNLEILDACLGKPYRNYDSVYQNYDRKDRLAAETKEKAIKDTISMKPSTSLPITSYIGDYHNDVYGEMKVVRENGELRMRFSHHPDMYARLEALGGNRFYATFTDPEFSKAVFPFTVEKGKVTGVTVKVADFVEYTPYIFTRK